MIRLYFYFFIFFIFSCNSTKEKSSLLLKTNFSYKTGFISGNWQVEEIDDKEYLFFGDFNTYKKILGFPINDSIPKFEFNLKNVIALGNKVASFEIINSDSAYLMLKKSNSVLLINKYGIVLNQFDFDSIVSNSKFSYSILRNQTPFLINDSTFLFSLQFNRNEETPGTIEDFIKQKITASNLLKIKINGNEYVFDSNKIYSRIVTKDEFASEAYNYYCFQNKILFFSSFSDTIFQLNNETLEIEKTHHIHSSHTSIGLSPLKVSELKQERGKQRNVFESSGFIKDMFFDEKNQFYFCFVIHKSLESKKPWSILVLDVDFNMIEEIVMDCEKYSARAEMTQNGLLISSYFESLRNNKNHHKENTLTLFNYE